MLAHLFSVQYSFSARSSVLIGVYGNPGLVLGCNLFIVSLAYPKDNRTGENIPIGRK